MMRWLEKKKGQSVSLLICASFVSNPYCSIYKGQRVLICKVSVGRCTHRCGHKAKVHTEMLFAILELTWLYRTSDGIPQIHKNQMNNKMKTGLIMQRQ